MHACAIIAAHKNSTPSKASNFCHMRCFVPTLGGNEKKLWDTRNGRSDGLCEVQKHRRRSRASTVPRDALDANWRTSVPPLVDICERRVGNELTRPASSRVKIDIGIVGLSNFPSGAAEGNRASWDFEGCKKSWISARQFISLGLKKELLVLV